MVAVMKKLLTACVCASFATGLLSAQPAPTSKPTDVPTAKSVPPKVAPAAKTAPVPVVKEEEPKIPGTSIKRDNGTWLGLEVVGGNYKRSFYDEKKKPMSPDVTRASARWPDPRGRGDDRTILNRSGNALVGAKVVLPPFVFNVYMTLLQGEGDEAKAVESYVIPFRG
jgi:hypothetical protein